LFHFEGLAGEEICGDREYTKVMPSCMIFKLYQGKCLRADAIRRHLKGVFKERYRPTNQDHPRERRFV
jgi:hypothetical protein